MSACPGLTPDGPFLAGMLANIDCQAQTIGMAGYRALASPGSTASIALTSALTVFVALFGYRMLFGRVPDMRDSVIALVKVGIVLALATSWPAYRTLVYDVVLRLPAELASNIGTPSGLPGASGGLVARLQSVDDGLSELVRMGAGRPSDTDLAAVPPMIVPGQPPQAAPSPRNRTLWDPARDQVLLGNARTLYLAGALGAFASVRLIAGLLLALGPLFALLLLFDATRGVFEGWVRALCGAALGGLATATILGVELALLEPWLAQILTERSVDIPTPAIPIELMAFETVFALTLLAGLIASAGVARGFHIPMTLRAAPKRANERLRKWMGEARVSLQSHSEQRGTPERQRAQAIADAAAAANRRDPGTASFTMNTFGERSSNPHTPMRGAEQTIITPIGQAARRRDSRRISSGANRRDKL